MKDEKVNPDILETKARKKAEEDDQPEMIVLAGIAGEFLMKQAQVAGKLKLLEQTLLNVHYLMHEGGEENFDTALGMTCLVTALVEGREPPEGALDAFVDVLNAVTTRRAKGNCQGHA